MNAIFQFFHDLLEAYVEITLQPSDLQAIKKPLLCVLFNPILLLHYQWLSQCEAHRRHSIKI